MFKDTHLTSACLLMFLLFTNNLFALESDSYLHLKPNYNLSNNKDLSDYTVEYLGDSSNVTIMNFEGNFDRELNGELNLEARQAATLEFYNNQPDVYDFLVFFTTFPVDSGEALAFNISFQNDVEGIGIPLFNNSPDMGSQRLQSTLAAVIKRLII